MLAVPRLQEFLFYEYLYHPIFRNRPFYPSMRLFSMTDLARITSALGLSLALATAFPAQAETDQIDLNLEVVAEGIETRAQYDFLREHGCEFGQGYLMGRPQAADQLASMLAKKLIPGMA